MVEDFKYLRADDFFRNSRPTTIVKDVKRELREDSDKPLTTSDAYRAAGINVEVWSLLGHQVVGAEVLD